jgi:aryl-alcohol dehydrogenase-like predicted oxidoreductase
MTFGTDWGWGASAGESAKQFEMFAEAGGTLIDTANKYTNGTAESVLGDLLAADRDHFVVGTKYSLNVRDGDLDQASHITRGFPHDFLASADFIHGGMSGQLDLPPGRSAHG